jgi:fatty-acyl-CoA synthase
VIRLRSTMQETPLLISQLLEYGATVFPRSEVVTWGPDGPRRSTYADVGLDARRLANALRGLGVTGDQRVATFMWNNEEHLECYLAVPAMGAVLHAINIRLFPQQMVYVMNHAEDRVVVVDHTLAEPFGKLLEHLPKVEHVIVNGPVPDAVRDVLGARATVHDYRTLLDAQPATFAWPTDLDENDGAAMCYTSGTTGNPKGVVYSHRSNVLHAWYVAGNSVPSLTQLSRQLAIVPLFHANAWGLPYAAFLTGANLVMPDRHLQAEPLVAMIQAERVTGASAVPTIWSDVLAHLDAHPEADVSSLTSVMVGGSACPPALMRGFQERHGVTVLQGWGMTETSPVGSFALPPVGLVGEEYWRYRYTQGRLAPFFDARLVGPDGSELPWDDVSVGELEVRGPWVTGSYYLEDDEEKFHDGWLRTGDVGRLTPDGFLTLTDRAKDVIKSGGEWISSVELENHLMAHPGVREASVVGVPDERWGERPLAAVVRAEGISVTVEELRDFLAERIAKWQLPERWTFIDEVPKTSVGKFDKKVIRARYTAGELDVAAPA